jgi:hypothetical protein
MFGKNQELRLILSDFIFYTLIRSVEEWMGISNVRTRVAEHTEKEIKELKEETSKLRLRKQKHAQVSSKVTGDKVKAKVEIRLDGKLAEGLKKITSRGLSVSHIVSKFLADKFGVRVKVRSGRSRWRGDSNIICIKIPRRIHNVLKKRGEPAKIVFKALEDITRGSVKVSYS